jgi:protein involved in polysaccharide export with SLBB domain
VWIFALGLLLAGCASDEQTGYVPTPKPVEEVRTVDPEIERWFRSVSPLSATHLLPGDSVTVDVAGLPEYGVTREIPPDGVIRLPRGKWSVSTAGKTATEFEAEVTKVYSQKLTDPYVIVRVSRTAPRRVYIAGAVEKPMQLNLDGNERMDVLKALTLAGGGTPEADLYGVTIMRYHEPTNRLVSSPPLDIKSVIEGGTQVDNLAVLPGDQIVVPQTTRRQVSVLGHVRNPGAMPWHKGLTLSMAITERGGFEKFAATETIRIARRDTEPIEYDFTQLLNGAIPDLELMPGDVIFIDERWI